MRPGVEADRRVKTTTADSVLTRGGFQQDRRPFGGAEGGVTAHSGAGYWMASRKWAMPGVTGAFSG